MGSGTENGPAVQVSSFYSSLVVLFKSRRFIQVSSFYSSLVIPSAARNLVSRDRTWQIPRCARNDKDYLRKAYLGKLTYGKLTWGKPTYGKPTCCATWRAGSRRPWSHSNAAWCFCRR